MGLSIKYCFKSIEIDLPFDEVQKNTISLKSLFCVQSKKYTMMSNVTDKCEILEGRNQKLHLSFSSNKVIDYSEIG